MLITTVKPVHGMDTDPHSHTITKNIYKSNNKTEQLTV